MNPLVKLHTYRQSFWYDNIRRQFLHDGTLQRLIDEDGLRGMTSNPSIFEQAIGKSDDYDDQMKALIAQDADVNTIYEALVLADIQSACDLFANLYTQSQGADGYVSLEVSPHLARDTANTISEARRLHQAVSRPNVMIKVPATPEGIPAIRQLIGEGININITLMFSMAHYEAVAEAYMEGLKQLAAAGGNLHQIASVASFFVSRVDSAVDKKLAEQNTAAANALLGQTAIANSKQVYQRFKELFHGDTFAPLRAMGAPVQRLLWASTSTKNPNYPDTIYVNNLIGPETVNTMPPTTVDAFRDHGLLANTLEEGVEEAQLVLDNLRQRGINLDDITEQLQIDGVQAFAKSFTGLMAAITEKRGRLL